MQASRPLLILVAAGMLAGGLARGQDVEYQLDQGEAAEFAEEEGEEEDEIETDRDSFTPATSTAGCGWTIFKAAYSFIDNRSVPETHSFPELLVRQGVGDWLELRLGWNYEVGGAGSPVSGNVPSDLGEESAIERESRLLYGFKA